MHFRTLGLTLLPLLLLSGFAVAAPGRAPAVEDFVGIEVEQLEATPQDENLLKLEQDLSKIKTANAPIDVNPMAVNMNAPETIGASGATPWNFSKVLGVLFILSLPLVSWLHVLNHMRKKATLESASNIEILEKYRLEREQSKGNKEDSRKAS